MAGRGPDPPEPPPEFFRRTALLLLLALGLVYAAAAWRFPVPWLTVPLGLLTLLVAPGYALGLFLFGYRPRWPWTLLLVSVICLSVGWSVGVGLLLLALGAGLPPEAFALSSLGLLAAAAVIPSPPARTRGAGIGAVLRQELRLPGHSRGERVAGYALLGAIAAVLGVILFLATVFPGNAAALSLGVTGSGSAPPPTHGAPNQTLWVNVSVGNNDTTQPLDLVVLCETAGQSGAVPTPVPWRLPLSLGPNRTSTDSLTLGPGQVVDLPISFAIDVRGSYLLLFMLDTPSGKVELSVSTPLEIR